VGLGSSFSRHTRRNFLCQQTFWEMPQISFVTTGLSVSHEHRSLGV